jgi:hypothetical protein
MLDHHSLARTCPPDQPFDPATIEAVWRAAYHAACHTLGLAERRDALNEISPNPGSCLCDPETLPDGSVNAECHPLYALL